MSQNIIKRIDDMGSRIDELETSIADLMQQVSPARTSHRAFRSFWVSNVYRLPQLRTQTSDLGPMQCNSLNVVVALVTVSRFVG